MYIHIHTYTHTQHIAYILQKCEHYRFSQIVIVTDNIFELD